MTELDLHILEIGLYQTILYLLMGFLFCGYEHRRPDGYIDDVGQLLICMCLWLPVACFYMMAAICRWTGNNQYIKMVVTLVSFIPMCVGAMIDYCCKWLDKKDIITVFFGNTKNK